MGKKFAGGRAKLEGKFERKRFRRVKETPRMRRAEEKRRGLEAERDSETIGNKN